MKRILGELDEDIIVKHNLYEHKGKKIVLYDNDRRHCENKHLSEFKDKKTFHYVMDNLEYIITDYDYVFYVKGYDEIIDKTTRKKQKLKDIVLNIIRN